MWSWMQTGGPVLWLLLAASLAGATIFFERLIHLHRAQIRPADFLEGIDNVLRRGNLAEAVSLCEETPGPVARIVRAALLHRDDDPVRLRQATLDAGIAEIPRLERRVRALAVISRLASLLGLLGTVLAWIDALAAIRQHAPLVVSADLAGALGRGLQSAAWGLGISIPAFVGHNVLVGRVESLLLDMEYAVGEILAHLSRRRPPSAPPGAAP